MVDRNQAVINFLLTCPTISRNPLYFNLVKGENNTNQILTSTEDRRLNTRYIDGSVGRRYVFTFITIKSMTDTAVINQTGYLNENVEDLSEVQAIADWIAEQRDLHNYPNFGEDCLVDDIYTTTDSPRLDGINTQVVPPLAMYSLSIQIDYLDRSKVLWN